MQIPSQLDVTDILEYFVPGTIVLWIVAFFYWNATGKSIADGDWLTIYYVLALLPIVWALGLICTSGFRLLVAAANAGEPSKIRAIIAWLEHTRARADRYRTDARDFKNLPSETLRDGVGGFLHEDFGIESSDDVAARRELFYLALRYLEQVSESTQIRRVGRLFNLYNVCARLYFVATIGFYGSLVFLILKVLLGFGAASASQLLCLFVASTLASRFFGTSFYKFLHQWKVNVWRYYFVARNFQIPQAKADQKPT